MCKRPFSEALQFRKEWQSDERGKERGRGMARENRMEIKGKGRKAMERKAKEWSSKERRKKEKVNKTKERKKKER